MTCHAHVPPQLGDPRVPLSHSSHTFFGLQLSQFLSVFSQTSLGLLPPSIQFSSKSYAPLERVLPPRRAIISLRAHAPCHAQPPMHFNARLWCIGAGPPTPSLPNVWPSTLLLSGSLNGSRRSNSSQSHSRRTACCIVAAQHFYCPGAVMVHQFRSSHTSPFAPSSSSTSILPSIATPSSFCRCA